MQERLNLNIFGEQADKLVKFIESNEILNTNAYNSTSIKEEADLFVEKFWYWKSFNSYLLALVVMTGSLIGLTYLF